MVSHLFPDCSSRPYGGCRCLQRTRPSSSYRCSRAKPGAKLLDVPCGIGRLTISLAEQASITGVDLCEEVLNDGRRAVAGQDVPAAFEHRDMRDLPWKGEFDGAFVSTASRIWARPATGRF